LDVCALFLYQTTDTFTCRKRHSKKTGKKNKLNLLTETWWDRRSPGTRMVAMTATGEELEAVFFGGNEPGLVLRDAGEAAANMPAVSIMAQVGA
jgi:hypothetical protein